MEHFMGRHCRICGAPISDDNPDGIGFTCREVWTRARNSAFYHFCGLDVWTARSNFWARLFVDTCKTTKFRSPFRKSFFKTIFKMVEENNVRLSKKMLSIITEYLTGYPQDNSCVPVTLYTKFDLAVIKNSREAEQNIVDEIRQKWLSNLTAEHHEYIDNLAKKFYSESKR